LKKTAFTMIELIIVIVVAGILAAVMVPRMERDSLREATNQVVRHIQFTQHLALVDDVYDANNANWSRALWTMRFLKRNTNPCYLVASDSNHDGAYSVADADDEAAIDPTNNLLLYASGNCIESKKDERSSDILLNDRYDIDTVALTGCSTATMIVFNNLGQPVRNHSSNTVRTTDCNVTLTSGARKSTIVIEKETGFTRVISFDSL